MTHDVREAIAGRRALVTGSAGVIGRELVALLLDAGAPVLSVDRLPLPEGRWTAARHLRVDLAEDDLGAIRAFAPQVVFHLAAAFERSRETPEFWEVNWKDNVRCGHRVVELARELPGVDTFVFASSYLIYDPATYLFAAPPSSPRVLREGDAAAPRNLCGGAKLYLERELEFLRATSRPGLRTLHARIFRVYGRGSRDVVSRWVRAALRGEPIEIYHPDNRFDYIFAADVAQGLLRLAASERAQGVVNLGSGAPRRVREVLDAVLREVPAAAGCVRSATLDEPYEASAAGLDRLVAATGWTPPTSLEDGVAQVVAFERTAVTAS